MISLRAGTCLCTAPLPPLDMPAPVQGARTQERVECSMSPQAHSGVPPIPPVAARAGEPCRHAALPSPMTEREMEDEDSD